MMQVPENFNSYINSHHIQTIPCMSWIIPAVKTSIGKNYEGKMNLRECLSCLLFCPSKWSAKTKLWNSY